MTMWGREFGVGLSREGRWRGFGGRAEIALAFVYIFEDDDIMRMRENGMNEGRRRMNGRGRSFDIMTSLLWERDNDDVIAILTNHIRRLR